MNDDNVMICQVCRRTLNQYTDKDGTGSGIFEHTLQDAAADHEPVAIPADDDWAARCDFCNVNVVSFRLPAHDFAIPKVARHRSAGSWAACVECAVLIDTNQWNALDRRVAELAEEHGHPRPDTVRAHTRALWRELRKNISGAMVPVE